MIGNACCYANKEWLDLVSGKNILRTTKKHFEYSDNVNIRLGWFDELATLRTFIPTLLLTRAVLGLFTAQISVEIFVNIILFLQSYKYLLLI